MMFTPASGAVMLCGWLSVLSMRSVSGRPTFTADSVWLIASCFLPSGPSLWDAMSFRSRTSPGAGAPASEPRAPTTGALNALGVAIDQSDRRHQQGRQSAQPREQRQDVRGKRQPKRVVEVASFRHSVACTAEGRAAVKGVGDGRDAI